MIYWFTGQPGSGKTTLANAFKQYLIDNKLHDGEIFMVDGDDLRELTTNKDYTITIKDKRQ
jgi:adenylylsulfate kinase